MTFFSPNLRKGTMALTAVVMFTALLLPWHWFDGAPLDQNVSTTLIPHRPTLPGQGTQLLANRFRDLWQKPEQVLDLLGNLEGKTVADIGCGLGYFTQPLARRVGPAGTVLAVDIQAGLLEEMMLLMPEELRPRVQPILANPQKPGLPREVDLIVLIQVLAEVPDQLSFLAALVAELRSGGQLLIIDSNVMVDEQSGLTRTWHPYALTEALPGFNLEPVTPAIPDEGNWLRETELLPRQFFQLWRKKN
jgi:SAM-dependent methyltransferase